MIHNYSLDDAHIHERLEEFWDFSLSNRATLVSVLFA